MSPFFVTTYEKKYLKKPSDEIIFINDHYGSDFDNEFSHNRDDFSGGLWHTRRRG